MLSTTEPISKETIQQTIQRMMQPKLWIHKQTSAPTHRFAHSHRCVYCMSISHTSQKCPQLQRPETTSVRLEKN